MVSKTSFTSRLFFASVAISSLIATTTFYIDHATNKDSPRVSLSATITSDMRAKSNGESIGRSVSTANKSKEQKDDTTSTKKWTKNCTLLEEGKGPTPVILMALGRSGSSVTWTTMSALTGHRNIAYEYTGGNSEKSMSFFEKLEQNPYKQYNWAVDHLCHIQQNREDIPLDAGIAGFQWKPHLSSFHHEYAIEGLRSIAAQKNPSVRVVYLTRNALDRRISNIRHDQSDKTISAHCGVGDIKCIEEHSKFDKDINLPTGNELMTFLKQSSKHHDTIRKRLHELDVQYVEVSYEKLFNTDDAEEWMRMFRFLKVGPSQGLTMADVRKSFSMAQTRTKSRSEVIANFKEVERTLEGTKFEHLLLETDL